MATIEPNFKKGDLVRLIRDLEADDNTIAKLFLIQVLDVVPINKPQAMSIFLMDFVIHIPSIQYTEEDPPIMYLGKKRYSADNPKDPTGWSYLFLHKGKRWFTLIGDGSALNINDFLVKAND